jgi:hypothetical protein
VFGQELYLITRSYFTLVVNLVDQVCSTGFVEWPSFIAVGKSRIEQVTRSSSEVFAMR